MDGTLNNNWALAGQFDVIVKWIGNDGTPTLRVAYGTNSLAVSRVRGVNDATPPLYSFCQISVNGQAATTPAACQTLNNTNPNYTATAGYLRAKRIGNHLKLYVSNTATGEKIWTEVLDQSLAGYENTTFSFALAGNGATFDDYKQLAFGPTYKYNTTTGSLALQTGYAPLTALPSLTATAVYESPVIDLGQAAEVTRAELQANVFNLGSLTDDFGIRVGYQLVGSNDSTVFSWSNAPVYSSRVITPPLRGKRYLKWRALLSFDEQTNTESTNIADIVPQIFGLRVSYVPAGYTADEMIVIKQGPSPVSSLVLTADSGVSETKKTGDITITLPADLPSGATLTPTIQLADAAYFSISPTGNAATYTVTYTGTPQATESVTHETMVGFTLKNGDSVIAQTELPVVGITYPYCGNGAVEKTKPADVTGTFTAEQCDPNGTDTLNYTYLRNFCLGAVNPGFCKYYNNANLSVSCNSQCQLYVTGDYCGDQKRTSDNNVVTKKPFEVCDGNIMSVPNSWDCQSCARFQCAPGYDTVKDDSDQIIECKPATEYCDSTLTSTKSCACSKGTQTCNPATHRWGACLPESGYCDPTLTPSPQCNTGQTCNASCTCETPVVCSNECTAGQTGCDDVTGVPKSWTCDTSESCYKKTYTKCPGYDFSDSSVCRYTPVCSSNVCSFSYNLAKPCTDATCGASGWNITNCTTPATPTACTPPTTACYTIPQTFTCPSPATGINLYYTTGNTTPTSTSTPLPGDGVTISTDTTFKVVACNGTVCSDPGTYDYTFGTGPVINSGQIKIKASADSNSFITKGESDWINKSDTGGDNNVYFDLANTETGPYSYVFDTNSANNPGTAGTQITDSYLTQSLTDGTYYFHVKPADDGCAATWGTPRRVYYDGTSPTCNSTAPYKYKYISGGSNYTKTTWGKEIGGIYVKPQCQDQTGLSGCVDDSALPSVTCKSITDNVICGIYNLPDWTTGFTDTNKVLKVKDNAGNEADCTSPPSLKLVPSNLNFYADYLTPSGGTDAAAEYSVNGTPGTTATTNSAIASYVTSTGLQVTPGAGNYISYPANGNLDPAGGTIELVVDGEELKNAGYSYLFDSQKGCKPGTTCNLASTDRISLYKGSDNRLAFKWWNADGKWLQSIILGSELQFIQNMNLIIVVKLNGSGSPTLMIKKPDGTTIISGTPSGTATTAPAIDTNTNFYLGSQVGGAQATGFMCGNGNSNDRCDLQFNGYIKSVKIYSN